jgi:DHA1 family purine ribonucleoside efflux pump-like MFS transporter
MTDSSISLDAAAPSAPRWSTSTWMSVISMAAATFALVSAEFLPAGLLTPMAADLGISAGMAGQVVTATATVGAVAALLTNVFIGRLNRKAVLIGLSLLAVASNILASVATDFWVLLLARAGLGIALSGFWALSAAVVARLVGVSSLGRGMSIIFVGVSLATIAAPSVGAIVSEWWGWRVAMAATAGAAILAAVLQFVSLPSLPASKGNSLGDVLRLLGRRNVVLGLLAVLVLITGHFSGFVYVRPFLEQVAAQPATSVALALLGYGVASVIGNVVGGRLADTNPQRALKLTALLLGVAVLGLVMWGASTAPAFIFTALWGLAFGAAPIVLQTNLSRAALDALEESGSLMVVAFQVSIALGAVLGGFIVDSYGVALTVLVTAVLALATLVLTTAFPAAAAKGQ